MATLTIRPNGDNSVAQTPFGTGSYNYDRVNESVEDDTNGNQVVYPNSLDDTYNFENHTSELGDISKVTLYAIVDTAGNFATAASHVHLIINGTQDAAHTITIKTTISFERTTNPLDSQTWEWSDIDAFIGGDELTPGFTAGKENIPDTLKVYQMWAVVTYTPASGANLFFANG